MVQTRGGEARYKPFPSRDVTGFVLRWHQAWVSNGAVIVIGPSKAALLVAPQLLPGVPLLTERGTDKKPGSETPSSLGTRRGNHTSANNSCLLQGRGEGKREFGKRRIKFYITSTQRGFVYGDFFLI